MINISLVPIPERIKASRFQHKHSRSNLAMVVRVLRSWVSYRSTDPNIETELDPRQSLLLTPRKSRESRHQKWICAALLAQ